MHLTGLRILPVLVGYLIAPMMAYPMQQWPVYPQPQSDYTHDDYYFGPQYFYDAPVPAVLHAPEIYDHIPYPYNYDKYAGMPNVLPKGHEERLSALPIGQETWFENDSPYRQRNDDDVSAAFLDNLILTQMAQDAQRRRENTRAALQQATHDSHEYEDYNSKDDEEVRELKALTTKPNVHTQMYPNDDHTFDEIEDYPADDAFINWNGLKRSNPKKAADPIDTPKQQKTGQKEEVIPRMQKSHSKRSSNYYNAITRLLNKNAKTQESTKFRRIDKRFVAGDHDLVQELRGLKHHIAT